VGVGVVGGAAIELVALAQFASDEETDGYGAETGGDPADGFDEGRIFLLCVIVLLLREGKRAADGFVFGFVAEFGAEDHDLDDSSGALSLCAALIQYEMQLLCHRRFDAEL
jgi:hypothetical protein